MNYLHIFKRFFFAVLSVMLLTASCVDSLSVFSGRKKARTGEFEYTLEMSLDNGNRNLSTRSEFFATEDGNLTFEDLAENAVVLLYDKDGYLAGSQFVAEEYIVEVYESDDEEGGDDDEEMESAAYPKAGELLRYRSPKKVAFSGGMDSQAQWRVSVEGWKMPSSGSYTFTFHDIKVNTEYYVYAIGNLPVPSSSNYGTPASWYNAITDYIVDNFGTLDQLQYYNVTKSDMLGKGLRIPYVHIPADKTFVSNGDELTIPLVRAMAKAKINVNTDGLQGDFTLYDSGISVRQTPTTCYVFNPGYAATSSSEIDDDGDRCDNGGVVYLYENCQGTLLPTNTNPANKNMASLASSGKAGLCTYIEVTGEYTLNDFTTDVTYRFYLGDNNTSNFDVRRNVSRTYTLYLTDANILNGGTGWKIDPENRPAVVSLRITPVTFSMEVGDTQSFTVTAIYNTGVQEDVTEYCSWSTSSGLSMSGNTATATSGNNDAYVTASWEGKSATATGKILAVTGIELVMPSAIIYGHDDPNIYCGTSAIHLQSRANPTADVEERQLQVYKIWNDGTKELVTDPVAEGVTFTKVSGRPTSGVEASGVYYAGLASNGTDEVVRATLNGMSDQITIVPKSLEAKLLDNNGNIMSNPYNAQIGDILPQNYAFFSDGVMTEWSDDAPRTTAFGWEYSNSTMLEKIKNSSGKTVALRIITSGTTSYYTTLTYVQHGSGTQRQFNLQTTVKVPEAPVVDNPTYSLKVTPASAAIARNGSEAFNAIMVTHHTNGQADDEAVVIATWSLTSGSSYAAISGQGTNTVRVSNTNTTYSDKSATLQASYNSMTATASLTLDGKEDEPWEEIVVEPASATIAATGSKGISAKIITHHTDGIADETRDATGATWSIVSGSTYATLNTASGASVTATGRNTTHSSQTVVVRASATGLVNATSTYASCTLTVMGVAVQHTYALEIVPGDDFTLTVGGYKQLKAYLVDYADGVESSRTDVTTSALWSSNNTSKVTVATSGGYERVTGAGETSSPVTVTATYNNGGQTLTDNVLVTAVYGNTFSLSGDSNLIWEWNEYGSSDGKSVHITAPANKTVSVSYVGGDNYDKFYKSETSFQGSKDITFYPVGKNISTDMGNYVASVRISCEGYSPITVNLTQYNGVEQRIIVDPTSATITYNGTQQYRAYLVYKEFDTNEGETEGAEISRQEVTGQCTWEVRTNTQNATISSTGLVTGTRSDWDGANYVTSTLRARYNSLTGTATVRVGKAPVPLTYALIVTPPTATVAHNGNQWFTAYYKTYENNVEVSSTDVSSLCTWSSSDMSAATINTAGRATGCNTTTTAKSTTITATYSGATGTAVLTVNGRPEPVAIYLENYDFGLNRGDDALARMELCVRYSDGTTAVVAQGELCSQYITDYYGFEDANLGTVSHGTPSDPFYKYNRGSIINDPVPHFAHRMNATVVYEEGETSGTQPYITLQYEGMSVTYRYTVHDDVYGLNFGVFLSGFDIGATYRDFQRVNGYVAAGGDSYVEVPEEYWPTTLNTIAVRVDSLHFLVHPSVWSLGLEEYNAAAAVGGTSRFVYQTLGNDAYFDQSYPNHVIGTLYLPYREHKIYVNGVQARTNIATGVSCSYGSDGSCQVDVTIRAVLGDTEKTFTIHIIRKKDIIWN